MFENILNDQSFLVIAVLLAIFIGFALVKKLFKIVLILLAIFMIYVTYLVVVADEDPDKAIHDTIEKIKKTDIEKIKEDAEKAIDKSVKKIKKKAKNK